MEIRKTITCKKEHKVESNHEILVFSRRWTLIVKGEHLERQRVCLACCANNENCKKKDYPWNGIAKGGHVVSEDRHQCADFIVISEQYAYESQP